MPDSDANNLTQLTVDLLGAYVANNQVEHSDLAQLIQSTHAALRGIETPEAATAQEPEFKGAVSLRKSLGSKSHIISMIDGKPYQTLKRHLAKHGLTPAEYRERYNLPKSYPMVAPDYSQARRAIAEKLGLGRKSQNAPTVSTSRSKSPPAADDAGTDKPAAAKPSTRKASGAAAGPTARADATQASGATPANAAAASPKRGQAKASKSSRASAQTVPSAASKAPASPKMPAKARGPKAAAPAKQPRGRKPTAA
jgi:predicted transcriptional regulator